MMHPVSDEALMRYIDDELPADERTRIEAHLRACSECGREVALYRALGQNLRRMDMAANGGSVWKGVSRRLTQPIGWALIIMAGLVYAAWGVYAWWYSPEVLWQKLVGGAVAIGIILLLASALIDRLVDLKSDPYRNVHR